MNTKVSKVLEYTFNHHQNAINTPNNGLFRNHNIVKGLYFNNLSTPMLDYLLNFCQEFQGDFVNSIAHFSSNPTTLYCSTDHSLREDKDAIKLPSPRSLNIRLDRALYLRNSEINFKTVPLTLSKLSSLLHYSAGVTTSANSSQDHFRNNGQEGFTLFSRSYASGGGLYPISLYFYANSVKGLAQGFYLYQPVSHTIKKVNESSNNIEDLIIITDGIQNVRRGIKDCSVLFFFSYDLSINYLKYGELSLVLALIDVGALIQNMHLTSIACKLGFCGWGGLKKRNVERSLKLDGIKRHVLMAAILGVNK